MKSILIFLLSLCLVLQSPDIFAKRGKKRSRVRAARSEVVVRHEPPVRTVPPLPELPPEVEKRFRDADESSIWDFWRRVILARSRLARDDAKEALRLLENLPQPPTEILNPNQTFYRRLYKTALDTGLAAARQFSAPTGEWERRFWAYFPDMAGASSVPAKTTVADRVTRMHLLSEASLYDEIPSLASPADIASANLPEEFKCRALFEWGWSARKLRKKEEALAAFGLVTDSHCEGPILVRTLYWKGLIESGLKRYDTAEATFKLLAKKAAGGRYEDDAYYRLAKIYGAQNDDKGELSALRKLTDLPEGDMRERHLWDQAFDAYRAKRYERANSLLDRIIAGRDIGTEARPQSLYWKGRIAEIVSKKRLGGSSAAIYRRVVKEFPFSFYSLLAEGRLGKSTPRLRVTKLDVPVPPDSEVADAIQAVDELNRKGDHQGAMDVMDYLTQVRPGAAHSNPTLMAQKWIESGDFNRALVTATEHFDSTFFDIHLKTDDPMTRALYPEAFPDEVKLASQTNNLPPAIIRGIMREESLFIPGVGSHAGAIGVMQLMPATARLVAKSLGISHSYADLKSPPANIRLGSSYFRRMMNRFDNQTALAVMAYNAGPGNVSKWLRRQGTLPMDEFIESIPLWETRGYVKRVMRSAHIYDHLDGGTKSEMIVLEPDPPVTKITVLPQSPKRRAHPPRRRSKRSRR